MVIFVFVIEEYNYHTIEYNHYTQFEINIEFSPLSNIIIIDPVPESNYFEMG